MPLNEMVPKITAKCKDFALDVILVDPIYKVLMGDENNASDMGAFCNEFDKIANLLHCSVIYCHHHSKGAQGFKRAMDRASGSGVFARDPDAQLDMLELDTRDVQMNREAGTATGWVIESSLREFPNIIPKRIWFNYPLHELSGGELDRCKPKGGGGEGTQVKASEDDIDTYFDECITKPGFASVDQLANALGVKRDVVIEMAKKSNKFNYVKGSGVMRI